MSFKRAGIFSPNPLTTRGVSTKLSAQKDKIVYTNGKVVIIRDLNNPASSTAYTEHVKDPTVARISPSGYYCASADISGTVRVWDTVGEDRTLKGEYKVIGGRINDIAWDGESKRIIAVGDGKEKFGHAFMMDTGTSSGEIIGHSKAVNAVSIRQQRPFRAATAGDDGSIIFHQGVPYKYDKVIKTHTKFVQDVRYDNTGDRFASVGSDSKIFLYDGKTGDTLGEITDSPHKGSIMACSWSPDSASLVTSSADCAVKLWDVETKKAITTWAIGSGVSHQQVGNVWSGSEDIVSLSMSSDLNIFDRRANSDKPSRVIQGPQKSVTSITPSKDSGTFLAGSTDGRILSFSTATSESDSIDGEGHTNLVSGLATSPDGTVYSIAYDDKVKEIMATGQSFTDASATLNSQPRSVAVSSDSTVFVTEINSIEAFRSNQKIDTHQPKYSPHAVAASGVLVAIGGDDQNVHLYEWDGKALKETSVLDGNKGTVSALAFSPDSKYIASGDSIGRVCLFDVQEKKLVTSRWSFHSARVNSLSWTSDSRHCASGSLDTHVYVWSVERPMKNIAIKNAGPGGVNVVLWTSEDAKTSKLVSGGADGCLRVWEVTFHA
ncbi:WD40 repeat-like protein [Pleurotus eryngii]|uniref:WD40 repeat-like protein n=1 Tax=Pleurotus eryngii TaxID=5323 RepID=A0A9P6A5Y8_PLEER|nr:WD40 repeat-like protein [Pleurotus eryngii]